MLFVPLELAHLAIVALTANSKDPTSYKGFPGEYEMVRPGGRGGHRDVDVGEVEGGEGAVGGDLVGSRFGQRGGRHWVTTDQKKAKVEEEEKLE